MSLGQDSRKGKVREVGQGNKGQGGRCGLLGGKGEDGVVRFLARKSTSSACNELDVISTLGARNER